MIGRTVAICTNGTRVLGLGDIGPVASMPVMEGKALFYAQMVGLSAMPILIDCDDVDEFVETVVRIAPGFGAIHLEDIRVPDCFEIERRLISELDEPVMHDDVHGTGVVTLAAALAACEQVGIELSRATVGQIGLGAAGFGIAETMVEGGAATVLGSDPNERSHERAREVGIEIASIERVMSECDLVVATTGVPGLIKPEMVRKGSVVFALTNPVPEIEPDQALAAGAAYAADGTSVNNVLGFPGIFRGALAAGAGEISQGDEARRGRDDRRPDQGERAGPRCARSRGPPGGRRRGRARRRGRGTRAARAGSERALGPTTTRQSTLSRAVSAFDSHRFVEQRRARRGIGGGEPQIPEADLELLACGLRPCSPRVDRYGGRCRRRGCAGTARPF